MTHDTPLTLTAQHLAKEQQTLLRKFYRSHNSPMRITPQAQTWVVRAPNIITGLCLSPIDQGYWLTSLFTAPQYRFSGAARFLLEHLQLIYQDTPIWLFCHPDLGSFYRKLGFRETQDLPQTLSQRLQRYQQHKLLIAMSNHPLAEKPQLT